MTREQQILSLAGIVHGAARRYPGDQDDLHQAAWIGAIRAVDTWDGRGSLPGYAWTCCNWELGRYRRTRNHTRTSRPLKHTLEFPSLDAMLPTESADNAARFAIDDDRIETAPERIDTRRLLGRLEPRDRAIVLLLTEYTQREVATALGSGQATIGRVVARARLAA